MCALYLHFSSSTASISLSSELTLFRLSLVFSASSSVADDSSLICTFSATTLSAVVAADRLLAATSRRSCMFSRSAVTTRAVSVSSSLADSIHFSEFLFFSLIIISSLEMRSEFVVLVEVSLASSASINLSLA